jgi:hypothetical protein
MTKLVFRLSLIKTAYTREQFEGICAGAVLPRGHPGSGHRLRNFDDEVTACDVRQWPLHAEPHAYLHRRRIPLLVRRAPWLRGAETRCNFGSALPGAFYRWVPRRAADSAGAPIPMLRYAAFVRASSRRSVLTAIKQANQAVEGWEKGTCRRGNRQTTVQ